MRNLVATVLLLLALPAAAQEARTYAILSLVGDSLIVVQRELSTGSNIDRNSRTTIAINNPALDHAVLLALDREIMRAEPRAKTVLLAARKPELFAAQSRALDAGSGTRPVLEAVAPLAAQAKATHLVLVTKHRREARLELRDGAVGAGRLEGLGFYVDPTTHVQDYQTGARAEGFIAPYAYFLVSLVDLRSGALLGEQAVAASRAHSNQTAITPWQSMTAEQKVSMLDWLIRSEAERVVPALLGKS